MIDKDLIERINFLAHKKKETGLTEKEQEEQYDLRKRYLKEFRAGFKQKIENIKVIDPDGNDITPSKIKNARKN
jgi:uncharacterized protein YnzC (UPF0291/DUF896 family)